MGAVNPHIWDEVGGELVKKGSLFFSLFLFDVIGSCNLNKNHPITLSKIPTTLNDFKSSSFNSIGI